MRVHLISRRRYYADQSRRQREKLKPNEAAEALSAKGEELEGKASGDRRETPNKDLTVATITREKMTTSMSANAHG